MAKSCAIRFPIKDNARVYLFLKQARLNLNGRIDGRQIQHRMGRRVAEDIERVQQRTDAARLFIRRSRLSHGLDLA